MAFDSELRHMTAENPGPAAQAEQDAIEGPGLDEVTRLLKSLPRDGQLRRELVRRRWQKVETQPARGPAQG